MRPNRMDIAITVAAYWGSVLLILYLELSRTIWWTYTETVICLLPPFAMLVRINRLGCWRAAFWTIVGFTPITLLGLFNLAAGAGRTSDPIFLLPLIIAGMHMIIVLCIALVYTTGVKIGRNINR